MKILFFGTSNVALPVLEELHRKFEIVGVVTQPDAVVGRKKERTETPVSVLAKEMDLKIFKPNNLLGNPQLTSELANLQPDISIVVSYGKIIPQEILDIPEFKTLNIHFSLLPKYRGAAPLQYALLNGDKETGISIFQLDAQLDHGAVLISEKHAIDPDDNFLTLSQRLAYASAKLITKTIDQYTKGLLPLVRQDETQATVVKTISRQDGRIDWNKTANQIYNQFRAFFPWPGVWTQWQGKKLKITDCKEADVIYSSVNNIIPGTVQENGCIACGVGTVLQIKSLQLEGKNETDIFSFLNGYQNFVGSKLE